MDQNVYPVRQGFPKAPDGGQLAPTASEFPAPILQGFAPAPLAYPLSSEPTPPSRPTNPAAQCFAPVNVSGTFVPPALEVDVGKNAPSTLGAPTFVVGEVGSLPTSIQEAIQTFTIAAVTDYETGGVPSALSVNLLIALPANSAPLDSFGAQLFGRIVYFTTGIWIPLGTIPQRPILTYGSLALVVPNKAANGTPLFNPLGPTAGNQIAIDVAIRSGEVVTDLLGIVQNVVPSTDPLLSSLGTIESDLPVQEINVGDQLTTIGTPVDYYPDNPNRVGDPTITTELPVQDVNVTGQVIGQGLPVDHFQSIHL